MATQHSNEEIAITGTTSRPQSLIGRLYNSMTDNLYTWYRHLLSRFLQCGPMPQHIAFIMDGNRRYAKRFNANAFAGHKLGEKKLQETLKWCLELGIKEVTVFAFSIENFKRSKDEVEPLMKLAETKFKEILNNNEFTQNNKVRVFGDLSLLPPQVAKLAVEVQEATKNNKGPVLNLCLAYTSTHEIAEAVRKVVVNVEKGSLSSSDISQFLLEKHMYTCDSLPVDIVVRTSGEIRLSDFLLWQSSTAFMSFISVLWPDFSPWNLYETVLRYQLKFPELEQLRNSKSVQRS